jgi:very-short-patch-repair endonuclease
MVMLKYNKKLIPRAQAMRREMTKEESKLWFNFLRFYEVKFRRQKVIDNFIADFYCAKYKLVVEIDGKHHLAHNRAEYDNLRSEYMKSMGIKIIRVSNDEINNNFNIVCTKIDKTVNALSKKSK